MAEQRLERDELLHSVWLVAAIGHHLPCDRTGTCCCIFPAPKSIDGTVI